MSAGRRSGTASHLKVATLAVLAVGMSALTLLAVTNLRVEPQHTYTAVFTDVSGMRIAADVRAAGVNLGRVNHMEIRADNTVAVEFTVSDEFPMTTGTEITVRYKNLLGDRYLELAMAPGAPMPDDATIPAARTRPALDIDELTNGFAPLLQGLQPDQVNELSGSLIAVLQGQADTVEPLLARIGSLTGSLADRDVVIGSLITDLNAALGAADEHAPQLDELVRRLQEMISGYAGDRSRLGSDLVRIDRATGALTGILPQLRPEVGGTVREVDRLSQLINSDAAELDGDLKLLPGHYQVLGRLGAYSSAFNAYLCGVAVRLPDGTRTPPILNAKGSSQRCTY